MSIQIQGNGGTVSEVDGTTFRAQRITARPLDAQGHFRYGGLSGVMAAGLGANSEIAQFRWIDSSRLAVIKSIRLSASVSTTFFVAGVPWQADVVKATGWTGQGTGGTGVAISSGNKRRTSYSNSLLTSGDIRVATTAALGAGTKTLESTSLSAVVAACPITASLNGVILAPTYLVTEDHPLILAQNEGFVIRSVAIPGTGTWTFAVEIDWAEASAY